MAIFPSLSTGIDGKKYSEKGKDQRQKAESQSGHSQTRPAGTRQLRIFQIGFTTMPLNEKELVRAFEESNFNVPFEFIIPGGEVVTVEFQDAVDYKLSKGSISYWDVTFTLEEK